MLETKFVEKIKTHILYPATFFRKSRRLWNNVEKYGGAREATNDNIIRRMRFAFWINKAKNTNSVYVNIRTKRTRLNDTLYLQRHLVKSDEHTASYSQHGRRSTCQVSSLPSDYNRNYRRSTLQHNSVGHHSAVSAFKHENMKYRGIYYQKHKSITKLVMTSQTHQYYSELHTLNHWAEITQSI
jgi:hypothetical protein